jgi:hypothetical protein
MVLLGPVRFSGSTKEHLSSTVVPVVDRVTDCLGVPRKDYEVSVVNLAATSSVGIGVEISGYSADLPVLLSLLSASLRVALKQDVACTGHVASLDGDLAPVRGISAKLEAVLSSPGISMFVVPELERDRSVQVLTPVEYKSAQESLLRHKGDIRIRSINGVDDAVRIFMTDASIALGSLRAGFFDAKSTLMDPRSPVNRAVKLLAEDNEKRFWQLVSDSLLNHGIDKARGALQAYVDFHITNQFYPVGFGEQLFRLVVSLPPPIARLDDLFPLVSMESYIRLVQFAQESDYQDISQLHRAILGEGFGAVRHSEGETGAKQPSEVDAENDLLERVVAELGEENLAKMVGQPLDKARASYITEAVTVKDSFEFNDTITSFYAHMLRHTSSPAGTMKKTAISAEAIDLVSKAFDPKGGYGAALAEGRHGTNGGMRLVFDGMTECLKQEAREKYIKRIFKETIDPRDWDAKVKLMEAFMGRIGKELPADLQGLPPKQLAGHWDTIIQHYGRLKAEISDLLKRL